MSLTRKHIRAIVTEVLEETTDALVLEEIDEIADIVADRIVDGETDVYDRDDDHERDAE